MEGTEFACYGEPVMIPSSMGSSSYLLRGLGNPDSLWSTYRARYGGSSGSAGTCFYSKKLNMMMFPMAALGYQELVERLRRMHGAKRKEKTCQTPFFTKEN